MKKLSDLIWYEKHRPDDISNLVLPKNYRKAFNKFIKEMEIPHLLFFGPAGSGKTTLGTIIINKIASSKLILNASSEDRGIATVKKKVKQFASSKRRNKKLLNIVFFDEAHGLTLDAQEALKNPMETYHKNCRFIFTCNHIDKMIEPIISRCMCFHFNTISEKKLISHIEDILEKEDIKFKIKNVKNIINRDYPDVRTIINNIQLCSISGKLEPKMINKSFDIKLFTNYIQDGKLLALRNLWTGSTDFVWIYKYLFNDFIPDKMPSELKQEAAITVAEYLYRDRTVADKEINMAACCIEIMNILDVNIDFDKQF